MEAICGLACCDGLSPKPDGTICNDGNPCTGTGEPGIGFDICTSGVCAGAVGSDGAPCGSVPDSGCVCENGTCGSNVAGICRSNVAGPGCETCDKDGDGLKDSWEHQTGGIDGDNDGYIDLNLYIRGARPDHKNVFVEVDSLSGQMFPQDVFDRVQRAFASAPVSNPDGNPGITLIFEKTENNIPSTLTLTGGTTIAIAPVWPVTSNGLPVGWAEVIRNHFGNPSERTNLANGLAKAKAYRYCIIGDQWANLATGTRIPTTQTFFVFMGYKPYPVESLAGTFMHELGHTLGLAHGGNIDISGKPNYVSVMNYMYQMPRTFSRDFWGCTDPPACSILGQPFYSEVELATLNERALIEPAGVRKPDGTVSTKYAHYEAEYGSYDTSGNRVKGLARLDGSSVNWDLRDPIRYGIGNSVTVDLNWIPNAGYSNVGNPSLCSTPGESCLLKGHDDWANLKYAVSTSSMLEFLGRSSETIVFDEPPIEEPPYTFFEWLDETYLPICPTVQRGPCNVVAAEDERASFMVEDGGTRPVEFQWRRDQVDLVDGGNIYGSSGPHLVIEPVTVNDIGVYDVVLTNICGTTISEGATLAVEALVIPDCTTDGLVDLIDYGDLSEVLSGPKGVPSDACMCSDLDHDGDVDLEDFALHQSAFGSGQ